MAPKSNSHTPEEVIGEILRIARAQETNYTGTGRRMPLNVASVLERPFRRLFLDHEETAQEAHKFFMGYAKRNPQILTPDAQKVVENLGIAKSYRLYVTELNVPQTRTSTEHMTRIELVSFHKILDTIRVLEEILRAPLNLTPFSRKERKGNEGNRYWSSHSLTRRNLPDRTEITDIKVRKRINGIGYSLPPKEVEYLQGTEFSHLLDAFEL